MFLVWVKVSVHAAGVVDLTVPGSGWAGWGIVGGILAVVLVLWHAWSLRRRAGSVGAAAVTAALAAATAGFTVAQALTGDVDVSADGTLFVTVTRQWPAEAAIALTAAVTAATATRLVTAATGGPAPSGRPARST